MVDPYGVLIQLSKQYYVHNEDVEIWAQPLDPWQSNLSLTVEIKDAFGNVIDKNTWSKPNYNGYAAYWRVSGKLFTNANPDYSATMYYEGSQMSRGFQHY